MDKALFDRIVQQLLPAMGNTSSRQALVQSALFGSPVLHQINWSGAARPFTVQLVTQLFQYDVSALVTVLEELKTQVGHTRRAQIDALIHDLTNPSTTPKGHAMPVDPVILIGFLLEVGRWAKSELSERWTLQREQQQTDLTDKADTQTTLPAQIADLPPREVERITRLIERRRDAIDRARNAKLADREEYDAQRLSKSAFEQREAEHNRTIQQMLDEIETDLEDLGFDVEREPA